MSVVAEQSGAATGAKAVSSLSPAGARERMDNVDVLRGFALFGILLVNVGFFAYPVSEPFYLPPDAGAADRTLHWMTAWLAQGKFYPLFSFLFGLGFAVQLERARVRGRDPEPFYMRRLVILMTIGLLHGIFIWAGDILTAYAFLGFLLLPFARVGTRTLLRAALVAYGLQLLLISGFTVALAGVFSEPATVERLLRDLTAGMQEADGVRADAWWAYANGSYAEITGVRVREFSMALQNMTFFGLQVFAMFLLGAWFGRRGLFRDVAAHRRMWKGWLLAGALGGLPLSAAFATINSEMDYLGEPTPLMGAAYLLNLLAGPLLALGYAAAVTLALNSTPARLLRVLAPVGRMALTNYLAQSVVCTLIFYAYGFELFAQLDRVQLVVVAVSVFAVQVLFSNAWLAGFRFGPCEWLWRSLTYLDPQPMRRAAAENAVSVPAARKRNRVRARPR